MDLLTWDEFHTLGLHQIVSQIHYWLWMAFEHNLHGICIW